MRPGAVRRRLGRGRRCAPGEGKRIQELEAQAAQLKRKYAKEVQPPKRNAAFKAYKQAKAELSLLKGE